MTAITLKRPVEFEGRTYSALDIEEPTVGGIEAYEKAQAAGATETAALVAMLVVETGWPEGAIRKVRSSDFKVIAGALFPLAEPAGSTGG